MRRPKKVNFADTSIDEEERQMIIRLCAANRQSFETVRDWYLQLRRFEWLLAYTSRFVQ